MKYKNIMAFRVINSKTGVVKFYKPCVGVDKSVKGAGRYCIWYSDNNNELQPLYYTVPRNCWFEVEPINLSDAFIK